MLTIKPFPESRELCFALFLFLISSVYFYTATRRALFDDGDALYAHVAQQMIDRDDWITPYANGVRFLDKPPMMYWLMAAAYSLVGLNEFAARLPSVLAVLATGCLLYLAGMKAAGHFAGFASGVAAIFCVGTFIFTRMVFPDVLFVFLLTLALYSFLEWYSDERKPLFQAILFYVSVAGALLAKGFIGVIFPIAIILLFLLWSQDWRVLKRFHIGKGTLLLLGLTVPWHLLAAWRNPGFIWHFFVNEQLLRFLGQRQPADYVSVPIVTFWMLILLWLFPWSVFFPAVGYSLTLHRHMNFYSRAVVRLSLCWAIVILLFFSFSSRIEHYSLPLFPPLALLVGITLSLDDNSNVLGSRRQLWISRGFTVLGILGGILAAAILVGALVWLGGWRPLQVTSETTADRLKAYTYYFAPLFDLPPQTLLRLQVPLVGTALVFSLGLLAAWWLNRRGRVIGAVLALSAMMVSFCLFTFQSLGACEEVLSSRHFGLVLNKLNRPGDQAIVVGDFETANSVIFYSPVSLDVYGGTAAVLDWGLRYPDAPKRILSRQDLESRWKGPQRTFLLAPDAMISGLPLSQPHVVLQSAGRTLLCNRPVDLAVSQGP